MDQYLNVLDICLNGREGYRVFDKMDRTGTGTRGFFGHQMRFDLRKGFPLVTTKKVGFRQIAAELIWFLRGETNARELNKLGAKIWDEWAVTWDTALDELLDRHSLRKNPDALRVLTDESIFIQTPLNPSSDFTPPEGWTKRTISRGDNGFIEYRHPHFGQIACERLCKHGFITNNEYEQMESMVGELGPVYGKQWRAWPDTIAVAVDDHYGQTNAILDGYGVLGVDEKHYYMHREIDQIHQLLHDLRHKPFSRRLIISGWNCGALPDENVKPDENALRGKQALPPCHTLFQFLVEPKTLDEMVNEPAARSNPHVQEMYENYEHYRLAMGDDHPQVVQTEELLRETLKHLVNDRLLHCHIYIRSNDVFLGMPFNIASYALMTMVFAKISGYDPGELVYSTGDTHLYSNHFEQAEEQLQREPRELPTVIIDPKLEKLEDLTMDSFRLVNYMPHERIKAPIAV